MHLAQPMPPWHINGDQGLLGDWPVAMVLVEQFAGQWQIDIKLIKVMPIIAYTSGTGTDNAAH